jgi:RNA polymerase sigma-70 factor, ECF subfamily
MTGSPSIAEDVTQEVFVALVRDLARYEPQRAGLSTYLYGVTRNVTRGRLRREQRFVNLDAVPANGPERAGWDDPSAAFSSIRGSAPAPESHCQPAVAVPRGRDPVRPSRAVIRRGCRRDRCAGRSVRSRLHRRRAVLVERLQHLESEGSHTAADCEARCLA